MSDSNSPAEPQPDHVAEGTADPSAAGMADAPDPTSAGEPVAEGADVSSAAASQDGSLGSQSQPLPEEASNQDTPGLDTPVHGAPIAPPPPVAPGFGEPSGFGEGAVFAGIAGQVPGAPVSGVETPGGQVPGAQAPLVQVPGGQVPGAQVPLGQVPGGQIPGAQVPGGQWGARPGVGVNLSDSPSASVGARVGARLINELIIGCILFFPLLAVSPFLTLLFIEPDIPGSGSHVDPNFVIIYILVWVLFILPIYLFNEVLFVKLFGANIGKIIFGLRMIDTKTGEYPSLGKGLIRFFILYAPMLLSTITLILFQGLAAFIAYGIGLLWWVVLLVSIATSSPHFQGLHDRMSGFKVVKKLPAF